MLKRSFQRYLFVIPITVGFLLFSTNVWNPMPVLVPAPLTPFVQMTEKSVPVILLLMLSFLLSDRYEIELGLVCGVSTRKLVTVKALPVILYIILSTVAITLCHRYVPYEGSHRIRIPIYVPDNYKTYLVISALVTTIFFAALFLFLRVLTRNCYLPLGIGLIVWGGSCGLSEEIRGGTVSPAMCWLDPFISFNFIGDTIPNAMAEKYTDLASMTNAWTYNRLMFFGLAVLLLVATWLLLSREKLHEGFGD